MQETPDPVAALRSKSIHTRAAAARDLSKHGTIEHIPLLTQHAATDKSPAVRLCTAGAASDILSRHLSPDTYDSISQEQREQILDGFCKIDPSNNTGLFSMLATIGLPAGLQRILIGLRDPRIDVRTGATVGLRRLCASISSWSDPSIPTQLGALLSARLKPDAVASVATLCAAMGYQELLPILRRISLPGRHGTQLDQAAAQLAKVPPPEALAGLWFSDGRDVGEIRPTPSTALLLIEPGEQGSTSWWLTASQIHAQSSRPMRRLFVRRAGEPDPRETLQTAERTWYRPTPAELIQALSLLTAPQDHGLSVDWSALQPTPYDAQLDQLGAMMSPDAAGAHVTALLCAVHGSSQAQVWLQKTLDYQKVHADVFFFLGECALATADLPQARVHWEKSIKRAQSKRLPMVTRARARLQEHPWLSEAAPAAPS